MMGKIKLFITLAGCFFVQAFGAYFSNARSEWYLNLSKPNWIPQSWVFAVVWPILYIMMALAFWYIWTKEEKPFPDWRTYGLFFLQLGLNLLWTPVFFYWQSSFLALIVIVLLWVAILFTILAFFRISLIAALLLVPYFVWVSYATALNGAIWVMN